jgi:hypothetical protein
MAMHRWLAEDKSPPPSVYPTVAKKELVPLNQVRFPNRAGVRNPVRLHDVYRLDFGPDFRTRGIVAHEPPKMGPPFAILEPQVDADGNEIGGLKTPQVAVPLAAHTGWNLRAHGIGAPDELFSMTGSYFPFTREAITERYRDRATYLARVREEAKKLAAAGYLLERDMQSVEAVSAREWDSIR